MKEKSTKESQKKRKSRPMVIVACPECGAIQWIALENIVIGEPVKCLICEQEFHQAW